MKVKFKFVPIRRALHQPERAGAQVRSASCRKGRNSPLPTDVSGHIGRDATPPWAVCHELTADRKGELAVVLHGGFRLIFRPRNTPVGESAGLDWSSVTEVIVTEIEDYH